MLNQEQEGQTGHSAEMFHEPSPERAEAAAAPTPQPGPAGVRLVERQLEPGETVLWSGRPVKKHAEGGPVRHVFEFIVLILICVIELLSFLVCVRGGPAAFLVGSTFFLIVALRIVFPNLTGKKELAQTVYVITDRRAMKIIGNSVYDWPLDRIESVEIRYYADGTGDLVMSDAWPDADGQEGGTSVSSARLRFLGVRDVDAADQALRSQLVDE